jgi:hypothetical protein
MNRPPPPSYRPQTLQRRGPKASRNTWLRLFNTFPDHPKWGAVAAEAGSTRAVVIATAAKLLTVANKGHSRGSVEDFSPEEWALTLGVPNDEVASIFDALHKCGWIDQWFLVTWDEHHPESEDPTRYERVKRHRQKKREEKEAERLARLRALMPAAEMPAVATSMGSGETVFQSSETAFHRNRIGGAGTYGRPRNAVSTVSETPRSEPEKERLSEEKSLSEGAVASTDDLVWLYGGRGGEGGRGLFLVMEGTVRGSELYARHLIGGWLRDLGGDVAGLNRIIEAVAGQASDKAYKELVAQHVANARDQAAGSPRLPLPPMSLAKPA